MADSNDTGDVERASDRAFRQDLHAFQQREDAAQERDAVIENEVRWLLSDSCFPWTWEKMSQAFDGTSNTDKARFWRETYIVTNEERPELGGENFAFEHAQNWMIEVVLQYWSKEARRRATEFIDQCWNGPGE